LLLFAPCWLELQGYAVAESAQKHREPGHLLCLGTGGSRWVWVHPVPARVGVAIRQPVVDQRASQGRQVRLEAGQDAVDLLLAVEPIRPEGRQDLDEEYYEGPALGRDGDDSTRRHEGRKCPGAESFDVGIDSCRVGLRRCLDRARFEQGRTRGSEVLTGCSHPRPHELLEVLVLGHGVSSSCAQVSPSTNPGQESTVSVSSEDSLPFAIRSMCWDHDLGWALDAPRTSIGRVALSSRALRGTSSVRPDERMRNSPPAHARRGGP